MITPLLFVFQANYIADLEFAAKIGKILLEQNQELDLHCQTLDKKVVDQDEQIRHLEKQLNILRDLEDNRCKVVLNKLLIFDLSCF